MESCSEHRHFQNHLPLPAGVWVTFGIYYGQIVVVPSLAHPDGQDWLNELMIFSLAMSSMFSGWSGRIMRDYVSDFSSRGNQRDVAATLGPEQCVVSILTDAPSCVITTIKKAAKTEKGNSTIFRALRPGEVVVFARKEKVNWRCWVTTGQRRRLVSHDTKAAPGCPALYWRRVMGDAFHPTPGRFVQINTQIRRVKGHHTPSHGLGERSQEIPWILGFAPPKYAAPLMTPRCSDVVKGCYQLNNLHVCAPMLSSRTYLLSAGLLLRTCSKKPRQRDNAVRFDSRATKHITS